MRQTILSLIATFALVGISSAQECAYSKKMMTLKSQDKQSEQISQSQTPVQASEQEKLLADIQKPQTDKAN